MERTFRCYLALLNTNYWEHPKVDLTTYARTKSQNACQNKYRSTTVFVIYVHTRK